jgi:hypothetical protein
MDIAAELLAAKPEKEARFLAMIVNKLGNNNSPFFIRHD